MLFREKYFAPHNFRMRRTPAALEEGATPKLALTNAHKHKTHGRRSLRNRAASPSLTQLSDPVDWLTIWPRLDARPAGGRRAQLAHGLGDQRGREPHARFCVRACSRGGSAVGYELAQACARGLDESGSRVRPPAPHAAPRSGMHGGDPRQQERGRGGASRTRSTAPRPPGSGGSFSCRAMMGAG
jgi:hypothetical protein